MTNPSTAAEFSIGQQSFDGLGRPMCVTVGGRSTQYHYTNDLLPACANTLADGSRIAFSYVPDLDNLVEQILPDNEPTCHFSYDPRLAQINMSEGELGRQDMTYTVGGKPHTDTWNIDGSNHVTTWRHSLAGALLGFESAGKVDQQRFFDSSGRLCRIVAGVITCNIGYDDFSRPCTYTTLDNASGGQLMQTITYDSFGREHTRTFCTSLDGNTRTQVQTLSYTDIDQVSSRQWQDDERNGTEYFTYDLLGRLDSYRADCDVAPEDPFGNRVVHQVFTLNGLDGYDKVLTTFDDGSCDEAIYHYNNPNDPCQVSAIDHTHHSWPLQILLHYDARGRLVADSLGRKLTWDTQDRLRRVEFQGHICEYGYDPSGNLCDRRIDTDLTRSFHSAGQITHEQCGDQVLQVVRDAGQLFALGRLSDGVRQGNATLLGCDAQGSVRVELHDSVRTRRYTAHGAEQISPEPTDNPFGFTGERREPLSGWYMPAGYRPYDPLLMIFLAPDSESPFARGGINPYAYCAGDPVNRIDLDGHAWWNWLVAGIGIVLGAVATVASFGAAAPALAAVAAGGIGALTASGAVAITAATLGAVSLGTGIASTTLEAVDNDSKAAGILGWISLGTGLIGTGLETGPKAASALFTRTRAIGRALRKSQPRVMWIKPQGSGAQSPVSIPAKTVSAPVTLYSSGQGSADVVFHPNYLGTGRAAFETHGAKNGLLMNIDGKMATAKNVGYRAKAWLDANRPEGEPFTLVACYAAESGAAQDIADVTSRPVVAYKEAIFVNSPLESMSLTDPSGALNIPQQAGPSSWMDKIMGRTPNPVPAQSKMFKPRWRIFTV